LGNVDVTPGTQRGCFLNVFRKEITLITMLRGMARTQETGQVLPNRKECGGHPTIAPTVENEETILNAVEEDGRYLKHWRNCAPIGYF
jgi:hypothetical protein